MNKSTAVIVITEHYDKMSVWFDGCGVSLDMARQVVSLARAALDQPDIIEQIKGASDGRDKDCGKQQQ